MIRRSPHTITYKDLYGWSKNKLEEARQKKDAVPGSYLSSLEGLTRDVACAEMLEKMLRKGLPGKQTDMVELFNSVNK